MASKAVSFEERNFDLSNDLVSVQFLAVIDLLAHIHEAVHAKSFFAHVRGLCLTLYCGSSS